MIYHVTSIQRENTAVYPMYNKAIYPICPCPGCPVSDIGVTPFMDTSEYYCAPTLSINGSGKTLGTGPQKSHSTRANSVSLKGIFVVLTRVTRVRTTGAAIAPQADVRI